MSEDFSERLDPSNEGTSASPLLARLYREIGLAAIAAELSVDLDEGAESLADLGHPLGSDLAA